jgi:hypothetical protein
VSTIRVGLRENRTHFSPGDVIAGAADWACDEAPKKGEIRLGWTTAGKGTTDAHTVATQKLKNLKATDLRTFQFKAPEEPYSFSGQLVSLVWAIELVMQPGNQMERCEIVIAPKGREVLLAEGPND